MDADPAEDIDERSMAALMIFALSAAFDLIDHPILLKCLPVSFGVMEKP